MELFGEVDRLVGVEITRLGMLIYVVRGRQVMMDRDLAGLYGIGTKILNRGVRRHIDRFPDDFMFQLTAVETRNWKSQIVTSNSEVLMSLRKRPLAFTEQGVAMLSSILRSKEAIRVNIEIMRAFVNMHRVLGANKKLADRMEKAEKKLGEHDGYIGTLFEEIEALSNPSTGPKRPIGFSERAK